MSELFEDPQVEADRLGVKLVLPTDERDLFLDLDSPKEDTLYRACMVKVLEDNQFDLEFVKRTTSPGGNLHKYWRYTWDIDPYSLNSALLLRIALQVCLGSDRKRELLSLLRVIINDSRRPPTTFFEKKEQA